MYTIHLESIELYDIVKSIVFNDNMLPLAESTNAITLFVNTFKVGKIK